MPTHYNEKDGENGETHQLNGLASPRIDEEERGPITRNEASNGKNDITKADIVERLIYAKRAMLG